MSSELSPELSLPVLKIARDYDHSPELLFEAWTDSTILNQWFFARPDWTCFVINDLRIGGVFHVEMTNSDGLIHVFSGQYLRIQAPDLVSFTWTSAIVENSNVTIEIESKNFGSRVVITHEGLWSSEVLQHHLNGWTGCLGELDRYLVEIPIAGKSGDGLK